MPSRALEPRGPRALVLCCHPPSWMLWPCFLLSLHCSWALAAGPSLIREGCLSPHPGLAVGAGTWGRQGTACRARGAYGCCEGCCSAVAAPRLTREKLWEEEEAQTPLPGYRVQRPPRRRAATGPWCPSPHPVLPSGPSLSMSPASAGLCYMEEVTQALLGTPGGEGVQRTPL